MKFPKTLLAALLLLGSLIPGQSQSFTYEVELVEESRIPGSANWPEMFHLGPEGQYYSVVSNGMEQFFVTDGTQADSLFSLLPRDFGRESWAVNNGFFLQSRQWQSESSSIYRLSFYATVEEEFRLLYSSDLDIENGTVYEGNLYFTNEENEFWVSDGTLSGTVRLHETLEGEAHKLMITNVGLLLTSNQGVARWNTITNELENLINAENEQVNSFDYGEKTFLQFHNQLWITDGSLQGSILLDRSDLPAIDQLLAVTRIRVNPNGLVFAGTTEANGRELWVSDGTIMGTHLLVDLTGDEEDGNFHTATNSIKDWVFFRGPGFTPWVSDGTVEGTIPLEIHGALPDTHHWDFNELDQTDNGTIYAILEGQADRAILRWNPGAATNEYSELDNIPADFDIRTFTYAGSDFVLYNGLNDPLWMIRQIGGEDTIIKLDTVFWASFFDAETIFTISPDSLLLWGNGLGNEDDAFLLDLTDNSLQLASNISTDYYNSRFRGYFGVNEEAYFISYYPDEGFSVFSTEGSLATTRVSYALNLPGTSSEIFNPQLADDELSYVNEDAKLYNYDLNNSTVSYYPTNGNGARSYIREVSNENHELIYMNADSLLIVDRHNNTVKGYPAQEGFSLSRAAKYVELNGKFYYVIYRSLFSAAEQALKLMELDPVNESTVSLSIDNVNAEVVGTTERKMLVYAGQLYYVISNENQTIWKYDPATDQHTIVYTHEGIVAPIEIYLLGGNFFATIKNSLYQLNDTTGIMEERAQFPEHAVIRVLKKVGDLIYFTVRFSTDEILYVVETTDWSVNSIELGDDGVEHHFQDPIVSNGKLIFSDGGGSTLSAKCWISDGTSSGTRRISDGKLLNYWSIGEKGVAPYAELNGITAMTLQDETDPDIRSLHFYDHATDSLYLIEVPGTDGTSIGRPVSRHNQLFVPMVSTTFGPALYVFSFGLLPPTTGYVYNDLNENGAREANEPGINQLRTLAEGPRNSVAFSDEAGNFNHYLLPEATYTISPADEQCWELTSDSASYTIETEEGLMHDIAFGFRPVTGNESLHVQLTSAAIRCGFTVPFWLTVTNDGCQPIPAEVSLDLGEEVLFGSADLPAVEDGTLLLWSLDTLPIGASRQIRLELTMPGEDFNDQEIPLVAIAENAAVTDTFYYADVLSCAIDPNDKQVLPRRPEASNSNYTQFDETLIYTVRFQNTGTDTAFTVRVEDQLSSDLDPATFRPLSASHPYRASMDENGLVQFLFTDIMLPDSNVNEPLSHGFVSFEIDFKVAITAGAAVPNTAAIYFDFNRPVITNTVTSTAVEFLDEDQDGYFFWDECDDENEAINPGAEDLTINGIDENCDGEDGIVNVRETLDGTIRVFPNPTRAQVSIFFSDSRDLHYDLYDLRGVLLLSGNFNGQADLNLTNLPAGIYLAKITDPANGRFTVKKLQKE